MHTHKAVNYMTSRNKSRWRSAKRDYVLVLVNVSFFSSQCWMNGFSYYPEFEHILVTCCLHMDAFWRWEWWEISAWQKKFIGYIKPLTRLGLVIRRFLQGQKEHACSGVHADYRTRVPECVFESACSAGITKIRRYKVVRMPHGNKLTLEPFLCQSKCSLRKTPFSHSLLAVPASCTGD